MTIDTWVLAGDATRLASMVSLARELGGQVTVAAVGPRPLADAAAVSGADAVAWADAADAAPAEAYAAALGRAVATAKPRVVLASPSPWGRALLGAAAFALGAPIVSGVIRLARDGDAIIVERVDLDGRVLETFATSGPLGGLFGGADATPAASAPAVIEPLALEPADVRLESVSAASGSRGGVTQADRVVSIGRGLKEHADLPLVEGLAAALGAELGCSMPIADDFGWVPQERYVGRSGQQISPRLYVAVGISGMPQHLDGIRDAKTVVAVNIDPKARIFSRAQYGIVGDLYEVVPALRAALGK